MSLILNNGIEVRSLTPLSNGNERVRIANIEISTKEFLRVALYILTNSDLTGDDDPKSRFVKLVKGMKVCKSINGGNKKRIVMKGKKSKYQVSIGAICKL